MSVSLLLAIFKPEPGAPPPSAARAARAVVESWDAETRDLQVTLLELPRDYRAATEAVRAALHAQRYDLFLLYDTDPSSEDHKLHQLAANYDDDPRPDADGAVRQDHIIDPDGPVAFRSRLPLDGVWDKLLVERVPVRMSHKATHVFNHVFYRALQTIHDAGLPTRGGAIETPPLPDEATAPEAARDLGQLTEETTMILAVLRKLYPALQDDA